MTPAPSAGGEEIKKKRKRKRSRSKSSKRSHSNSSDNKSPNQGLNKRHKRTPYAKRVDEVSAGGLVINKSRTQGLLIGRLDAKDPNRERLLWSLPKGHIEEGESAEAAALREVKEETGIESEIDKSLGVIDFWFMAGGKRIHKTVHHFLFKEVGGKIAPQVSEVDDVRWFPLDEIVTKLAYPDEKKLISRSKDLLS
ncbi:MAG: NUDIX hydrolase [Actinomycetota bacterium]|jgi:8-oxo-dGTP pyrophosphatase MutT (NUDIX family)|nr:putative mutator protein MutT4 [Clavibacter sp.]HRD36405.1 NUDIX domain-containing protein [Candidatus Nanopelagicaceae bacterium]